MDPSTVMEWSTLTQNIAFPIIILGFIGFIILRMLPVLIEYVKSLVADKQDMAEHRKKQDIKDGELQELIRNTSTVINNNTAALSLAESNNQLIVNVLGKHMDESRAAHARIEEDIKCIDVKADKLITDVKIIKETK